MEISSHIRIHALMFFRLILIVYDLKLFRLRIDAGYVTLTAEIYNRLYALAILIQHFRQRIIISHHSANILSRPQLNSVGGKLTEQNRQLLQVIDIFIAEGIIDANHKVRKFLLDGVNISKKLYEMIEAATRHHVFIALFREAMSRQCYFIKPIDNQISQFVIVQQTTISRNRNKGDSLFMSQLYQFSQMLVSSRLRPATYL